MTGEPAAGAAGPGEQQAGEKDPVALLVQAVNRLPADDRDQVFAWLLRVGWRSYGPSAGMLRWSRSEDRAALYRIFAEAKPASAAQQMVPVRFPADQHARLRGWCAEHGFSMATVIRGLVIRFLDEQVPEHN